MPADTRPAPTLPSTTRHGIGRRPRRSRDGPRRQHILHRRIHQHVQDAHQGHAEDQRARNVAFGIANFSRDHVQIIPAVVGPERGHQSSHEAGHSTFGAGKAAREVLPASAAVAETDDHDAENDGDFQESEHQLKVARLLDPDVVEDGNQRSGRNCHQLSVGNRKRARNEVVCEEAEGRESFPARARNRWRVWQSTPAWRSGTRSRRRETQPGDHSRRECKRTRRPPAASWRRVRRRSALRKKRAVRPPARPGKPASPTRPPASSRPEPERCRCQ